ncbi:MAG: CapA family protein [Alistipes sp.]|nr:CapA family protein [Alistipes sp.]
MKNSVAIMLMFAAALLPLLFAPRAEVEDEPQARAEVRRARIVVAGDLMQHDEQLRSALKADSITYDYEPMFRYVGERFRSADLAMVNLETTLSAKGPYSGYPAFRSPAALAYALKDAGVDVAALANNHCCDAGGRGIASTVEILDEVKILHTGAFKDSVDYLANNILYFERCGIRFALLNYTYGTNGIPTPKGHIVNRLDTVVMARDIASISREEVDFIMAFVHWGNEYERTPNREQRAMAEFLKRHGVEIIIGSHPHVVQPMEMDSLGRVTIFSLGNFVSNQRTRYRDGGLIATIDVEIVDSVRLNESFSQRRSLNVTLDPVWVHLPDYVVLPREVGDTIKMSEDSRRRYDRFMQDVEDHIGI